METDAFDDGNQDMTSVPILILSCQYLYRGVTRIALREVYHMKEAEYITILSNRRKVKIQKDQILYVRSRKKHLEVHVYESTVYMTLMPLRELTKELGEGFIEVQRGCIVAERAIDRIADRIYLVNGEALTYTVRNKKEIVEKLEMIDYSPEIDTYLKVICFPTFPGHCGCILFNIEDIRFTKNSGDAEKALMQYLQNED